jgi:hypothetical protein
MRSQAAPHGYLPQELSDRITTLHDVTNAHTQQQRVALARRLWHSVELLNLRTETLRDKAAVLSEQLQQQPGVTQELAQSLITMQPSVLVFRPDKLAQKVADMGQRLGVLPPVVLSMWLRQRSMISTPMDTINAKMLQLAGILHLQDEDLRKLVISAPTLLACSLEVVQARFENLLQTLPHDVWTAEMLGAALLSYPAVLTYRAETVRHKWTVVSRYAAAHEPSMEQLQQRLQSPKVLNVFSRPDARIAMIEYIMQQPPQQPLPQQAAAQDTQASSSGDSSSSSSSRDRGKGRQTMDLLVEGQAGPMPRLMCVLSPDKAKWEAVQQQYPGFAEWYQQRKEEMRKQRQPRQQEEEEEGEEGEG